MAEQHLEAKVSPEGRVVIPASVRKTLDVQPGDTVRFIQRENGEVMITTARALVAAVWANNHGGDRFDAAQAVRAERAADQQAWDAAQTRETEHLAQPWDEQRETARVLAELGFEV